MIEAPTLTHEKLRQILGYDPATGIFTWLRTSGRAIRGARAGSQRDDGYWVVTIAGRNYRAHRLAWFYLHGTWPTEQIDHESRDRGNNALGNLRDVAQTVNMQNIVAPARNNRTGIRGVSFNRRRRLWCAQLTVAKKLVLRKWFKDQSQAQEAYIEAKRLHHACTF